MFKEPKAGLKNEKRFADFHNKVISVALLIFKGYASRLGCKSSRVLICTCSSKSRTQLEVVFEYLDHIIILYKLYLVFHHI